MPEQPPIKRLQKASSIPRKRLRFDVIGKDDPRRLGAWNRLRDSYRQDYPICQRCKHIGQLDKYSTINLSVHHIEPLFTAKDSDHLYQMCMDVDNLLTLCAKCHAYYSALERTGYVRDLRQSMREGQEVKRACQL